MDSGHLEALEAARRFRLDRHALSAEQIERLARELPLPHLLVPALAADAIGAAETETLAHALADAVAELDQASDQPSDQPSDAASDHPPDDAPPDATPDAAPHHAPGPADAPPDHASDPAVGAT
jgi:hypothetical protein